MEFLNQIGSKVMDLKGKTMVKAWEMSEIRNLSTQIKDLTKEKAELYSKIGMKYAELHLEDAEPALEPLCKNLLVINKQIESLQTLVTQMKGLRTCPGCGAEVGQDDVFCCRCGAALPKIDLLPEGYEKCPACGGMVRSGMKFCTKCGNPMNRSASSSLLEEDVVTLPDADVNPADDSEKTSEVQMGNSQESLRNSESDTE